MLIALFTEVYPPTNNPLALQAQTLHDALTEKGYDVLVVTTGKKWQEEDHQITVPVNHILRLADHHLYAFFSPKLRRHLLSLGIDAVIIEEDSSLCLMGENISTYLGIPLIYRYHPDFYRHSLGGNRLTRMIGLRNGPVALRRILSERGLVVVSSEEERVSLRKAGILDPLFLIEPSSPDLKEKMTDVLIQAQRTNF
jgi:hypothetical protein